MKTDAASPLSMVAATLEAMTEAVRAIDARQVEAAAGPTPMLTPAAIAERLSVDPNTVYRLIREGHIRGVRVGDGAIRVEAAEFDRFVKARTQTLSLVAATLARS